MDLIFGKSISGRTGVNLPQKDVPGRGKIPSKYRRQKPAGLPEVSELDVVRHFTKLSQLNFSIDTHFYPLGSCTMKYNPKFCEKLANLEGFSQLHPLLPQLLLGGMLTQGALEVLYNMEQILCEITGMDKFTLQPLAGAHGELTGTMMIAAYHKQQKQRKKYILVPDSAHGTNPASAAIAGYQVKSIPSDETGVMDMQKFKENLNHEVAAVMLTSPNTLGLFNPRIKEIADHAHKVGALMYYDGANLNAIAGKCKPGEMGFDLVHLNLHKTFATPHGGGGPGAGPVGVKNELIDFLPTSWVIKRKEGSYALEYERPQSIGYVAPFYGNFSVILKAYAYILTLGKEGLVRMSEAAVLNANYAMSKLKRYYHLPYPRRCMHEFVISAQKQLEKGVKAIDIAKALIDKEFHPPTMYFPQIVPEAMMIEPTETESKQTLDAFIEAMISIARQVKNNPDSLRKAPCSTPVSRLDEVKAARQPNLRA